MATSLLLSSAARSSSFLSRYRLRRPSATAAARSRIAALSTRRLDASLLFYGRRHGGSYARNPCLLRLVDGSGSQEVDMLVIGKQRDQGEEQGGKNRDPALTVKSQNHRSQPKP